MPNRQTQPGFITSNNIRVKKIEKTYLGADNIPLYYLNFDESDIIKLDFIFEAGKIYHSNPIIPEIANALIYKGTQLLSSEEISEKLDFYGAYLETSIEKHNASVTLYTLNKYFKETFKLVFDIIFNAFYFQNEIDLFLNNKYRDFMINKLKTNVVASELFVENIFGKNHPYGKIIDAKDFENISREQILAFYLNYYSPENMFVMLSGKISSKQFEYLKSFFGKIESSETVFQEQKFSLLENGKKEVYHKIKNAVQSSVRVGKLTVNKVHPDYFNLNITSVILGGYFGSRLMMNLREDKGYTYGIYSGNISLLNSGYFLISAESGTNVYEKALEEIYKELKILRTIPVKKEELERVKRWLFGNIIKIFDGPLAISDTYKSIIPYGLSSDYFEAYFNAIKNISPSDILEISHKYLHENTMTEVVAGA